MTDESPPDTPARDVPAPGEQASSLDRLRFRGAARPAGDDTGERAEAADEVGPPGQPVRVLSEPGPTAGPGPTQPPAKRKDKHGSFLRELPVLVLIALGLALLIKAFLVQAFYIPSGSMEQTLKIRDRVLVNKLIYRIRDVHRGEIVVFKGPETWNPEVQFSEPTNPVSRFFRSIGTALGFAPPGEKDFIKRVIGVPGDAVQCCDAKGRVTVNGHPLTEPYVYQDNHAPFGPVVVPKGRLWVMGDHRGESADSRSHIGDPDHGTIPIKNVVGRAFVIVWPPSHFATLSVPKTFGQKGLSAAAVLLPAAPYLLGMVGTVPVAVVRRRRRRRRLSTV